jgi:hypothetical protein
MVEMPNEFVCLAGLQLVEQLLHVPLHLGEYLYERGTVHYRVISRLRFLRKAPFKLLHPAVLFESCRLRAKVILVVPHGNNPSNAVGAIRSLGIPYVACGRYRSWKR